MFSYRVKRKFSLAYLPEERLVKSGNYTLYRGVRDIFPKDVDPRLLGKGVFGNGTYFAVDPIDARRWVDGTWSIKSFVNFALISSYQIAFKSLLTISPEMVSGLHNVHDWLTIDDEDLAEYLGMEVGDSIESDAWSRMADDLDGVHFNGGAEEIDGGEQVLVFPQSKAKPKLLQTKLIVNDCKIADEIHRSLQAGKLVGGSACGIERIPASKMEVLDEILRRKWQGHSESN